MSKYLVYEHSPYSTNICSFYTEKEAKETVNFLSIKYKNRKFSYRKTVSFKNLK